MESTNDTEIAANLAAVITRLIKILRKEANDDSLSLTERSTLKLVYAHGEILPTELAAMEKVTTQSMSQIINKLTEQGYVKRTASEKDKRKVLITITPAGRNWIENNRNEKKEWLSKAIQEKTTSKEKETLTGAIKVLTKLVDLK